MNTIPDFDVVIVGGRPAGAALAARLGAAGRRVLIVDKATFPSPPQVPSCPILYPQAMAELDEIGLPEAAYADACVPVRDVVFTFGAHFEANLRMIDSRGRDYVYGLDRVRFDGHLWRNLLRFPSVEARAEVAMTDLLREGGRVVGVELRGPTGTVEQVRARVVVGADGRFSPVARKAGAEVVEDRSAHASSVLFADWRGLGRGEPQVEIFTTGRGTDVLFFPLPDGLVTVCIHNRADRLDTEGDASRVYLDRIRSFEHVRQRLDGAEQVGPLLGMKRVANAYRRAGGPGWVLVGDALHHKDPVDGQGIYDALMGAKRLAGVLGELLAGERDEAEAWSAYEAQVRADTHAMFVATTDRLKQELYGEPPVPVIRTIIRWMMTDPIYQRQFMRYLCREVDPARWLTPGLMAGAAARGVLRDLGWRGRASPAPAG